MISPADRSPTLWPEADWRRPISTLHDWHGPWTRWALVFLVVALACALLPLFDNRLLLGVSVWTKPFKFALSIAVYFATLAAFAPLLGRGFFDSRVGKVLTATLIVCAVFEQAYIVHQAALGESSHFNYSTPFHSLRKSTGWWKPILLCKSEMIWALVSIKR